MPRYNTNMADVTANFVTLIPKGHYKFKIGTAKAFANKETKDGVEIVKNYGIRYPVEIVDVVQGDGSIGDRQFITLFQHTKGAVEFSKGYHMVLCGFDQNNEGQKAYNEKFGGSDYSFDTDTGEVGDAWKACEDSFFEAAVSVNKTQDGEFQKWDKLIPFQG